MAEQVVIEFGAETSGLDKVIDLMEHLGQITKEDATKFRKLNDEINKANKDIVSTAKSAKDLAGNLDDAGNAGKKAGEEVKKGAEKAEKSVQKLSSSMKDLGKVLLAAFAVKSFAEFAHKSVEIAKEVEQSEARLLLALGNREGLTKRLLSQAKELSDVTGVSDKAITKQQIFLAQQGRTADQIDKTIKAAIRLSKVTGEDLSSAVERLDGTLEGNIRGLEKLDDRFKGLTKAQLESGAAVDLVNEKYSGVLELQTESEKATNRYANAIEDLELTFGRFILKATPAIEFLSAIIERLDTLSKSDRDIEININTKETNGAVENALKDFEASRNAYEKIGKSSEEAITLALQDEISVRDKLILGLDKKTQARQILIFAAQKEALKENAQAELDALTANDAARAEAARKAQEEKDRAAKKALDALRKAQSEEERIRKEIFTHQQQLNRESAAETSKLQVLELKKQEQLEIQAINNAYIAKGDFSKAAEIKLQQDLLKIRIEYLEKEALLFEDDKVKQAEIANQIIALKTEISKKDIDITKATEDEKTRIAEEAAKKRAKLQEDVFEGLRAGSALFTQLADNFAAASERQIDAINEQLNVQLDAYDQETKANDDSFQRKTITEIEYRRKQQEILKQKELAEAEASRKSAELRKKEYTAKKLAAMFEIIVNTAAAVAEALPVIPLSILVGALGAAQLAFVASQPVPKFGFNKGTLSVPGTGTSDTVHAMLTPGEAVIPRDKNIAYRPSISAMFHGKISPKDMNDLVNWKLSGGAMHHSAAPIDYEKLASAIVWNMNIHGKKGVKILNWNEAPYFGNSPYSRQG